MTVPRFNSTSSASLSFKPELSSTRKRRRLHAGLCASHRAKLTPFRRVMALSLGLSVVGLSQLGLPSARAVVYTWDSNGATAGFGVAGGTWAAPTIGSPGWTTDPAGATVPGTVTTTTADALNFGTATLGLGTGTITVSGTVAAGSLTYGAASGAITLSGGTITLGTTGTGGITNNSTSVQIFNTNIALGVSQTWTLGAGATFNNPISGAFATRIDSAGTVTLAADNSGYAGVTTAIGGVNYTQTFRLNTGTTVIGTSTSLGGTGTAVDFRSTLAAGTALTGANKLTNTFVIATGTATIGGSNNIELGGAFNSSNGGTANTLAVINTGTTTLSGTVSLSDSATVTKGLVVDVAPTAGAVTISGVIQNFTTAGSGIAGALAKTNAGTLILTNNNTYTGATVVAGTLIADFSNAPSPTNIISASSALTLSNGTLGIKGQNGSTTAQTFASLALSANTSEAITVNQNGATAVNLTLNGITRNSQSALDITLPTAGTVTTTATGASGGLLADTNGVSYATANGGTNWLAKTGTTPFTLSALNTYSTGNANYVTGNNVDVTNGDSVTGVTVNTLRLNGANIGLTLAGTNIVSAGGILVTPGSTGTTITGGMLTSSTTAAELIIHEYGSLNINSAIANANAGATATKLTLTGPGTTTLSGTSTYTGLTNVNFGILNLGGSNTTGGQYIVNNNGVINFNGGNYSGTTAGFLPFSAGTLAGLGTINVTSGTVIPGQFLVAGITTSGAFGIWNISGGTVATQGNNSGTLGASTGTTGLINLTGNGVYNSTSGTGGLIVGENNAGAAGSISVGVLNVSGSGLATLGTGGLNLARNRAAIGIVNLGAVGVGGGTIQTPSVFQGGGTTPAGNIGLFNFHGGTLKATTANATFFNALTAAPVYSEGGTIDNNGVNITIGQAFVAPVGNGANSNPSVASGGTGYVTAPYVTVNGAGGLGATAVATVSGGAVTGVTITNPGTGYTGQLSFTLTGGGGTGATIGTVAQTADVSGGVTYLGAGTTTLSGASTYTGPTNISVGTIKNGVANTIPAGSALTVSGGTYDLNGFADTVARLSDGGISSGTVTNSSATASVLTVATNAASTYSGLLSGNLSLVQTGTSLLTISRANNSFTGGAAIGTAQNGSVLRATASGALGTGALVFDSAGNASTARLELTGGITLPNAISFTGRGNASVGIESISGNNTLSGLVTLGTGGGIYIVQSDADTLAFTNTGATTIATNKTLTFTGVGNGSFAGALTSVAATSPAVAGGVAKSGAGIWTLTGANAYVGPTSITGGTLAAASAAGNALGSTSGIAVSGGGTLLLSLPNQVLPAAVASTATPAAAVTLGVAATSVGNVTAAAGASQGSAATASAGTFTGTTAQGLGALTLNNTATLTFGGASTTLVFNTFTPNGNVLTISGYVSANFNSAALISGSGTDDRLVFFGDQSGNYGNFNFGQGAGVGVSEVALDGGFYEIGFSAVAVPEPTTWLGGLLLAGAAGYGQRRRLRSALLRR